MVQYRRNLLPGGTYFFTVALHDRTTNWLISHVDLLRRSVAEVQARRPFAIDAAVILPDHLHMIWTLPPQDTDFAWRWGEIKRRFVQSLASTGFLIERDNNGKTRLWQRRFWEHTIRDEQDFANHVDYIHINPVKHGLVTRPTDWPHSSIHQYIRRGILPTDWAYGDVPLLGTAGEPTP